MVSHGRDHNYLFTSIKITVSWCCHTGRLCGTPSSWDTRAYLQSHCRVARCSIPISCLDPLYSTRVPYPHQDCGSSSLLPRDSRLGSSHHSVNLRSAREAYSTPTLDTFFHSPSYSMFPCTRLLVRSVYILHKAHIHAYAPLNYLVCIACVLYRVVQKVISLSVMGQYYRVFLSEWRIKLKPQRLW